MPEFLRDPIWQFVGAVIGALGTIAAIVFGIALYVVQRRRKALSYEVLTQADLVKVEEGYDSEVEILYQGQPVEDVSLITLKILNSGNVPITEEDYERPVTFSFGENAKILSADILDTKPKALYREHLIVLVANKLLVGPDLLNPGDWITVKVLVGGSKGQADVDGRIVGVKDIQVVTERRRILWWLPGLTFLLLLLALLCITLSRFVPSTPTPVLPNLSGVVTFVVGIGTLLIATILVSMEWWKRTE